MNLSPSAAARPGFRRADRRDDFQEAREQLLCALEMLDQWPVIEADVDLAVKRAERAIAHMKLSKFALKAGR